MEWVKRNLRFVIGAVVAVALMGVAGWYCYTKWSLNQQNDQQLRDAYNTLADLINKNPNPGNEKVDNIAAAEEQRKQIQAAIEHARKFFQPVTPIPNQSHIGKSDFSSALQGRIAQLQHRATVASVNLEQKDYAFSFQAQRYQITFSESSLPLLAQQLGEVDTICSTLYRAKVNSLAYVRRERVCDEDLKGSPNDYLDEKATTNELAVLAPYEISFQCFSRDLADVLTDFSTSSNGIVVRSINVVPGGETGNLEEAQNPAAMGNPYANGYPNPGGGFNPLTYYSYNRPRYGYAPQPAPGAPGTPGAEPTGETRNGLPVLLNEKQLKVTMSLIMVRFLPMR